MLNNNHFSVLHDIPAEAQAGMHRDTKKIIEQLRMTKGKVLSCKLKSSREAKNRLDALRRAKKRGHVRYREGRRKGQVLYFRVR